LILPVTAYLIAYAYQAGLYDHFSIPWELIDIGFTELFIAFTLLAGTVLFIWFAFELMQPIWTLLPEIVRSRLRPILFGALFGSLWVIISGKKNILPLLIMIGLFLIVDLLIPLFKRKTGKTYLERLEYDRKIDHSYESVMDKIGKLMGLRLFIFLFVTIIFVLVAYTIGLTKTRSRVEYLSLTDHSNSVVLSISRSRMIWTTYDTTSHHIADSLNIEIFKEGHNYKFKHVLIEELKGPSEGTDTTESKGDLDVEEKSENEHAIPSPSMLFTSIMLAQSGAVVPTPPAEWGRPQDGGEVFPADRQAGV